MLSYSNLQVILNPSVWTDLLGPGNDECMWTLNKYTLLKPCNGSHFLALTDRLDYKPEPKATAPLATMLVPWKLNLFTLCVISDPHSASPQNLVKSTVHVASYSDFVPRFDK